MELYVARLLLRRVVRELNNVELRVRYTDNYTKRKLKRAKHTNDTKRTKDTNEKAKVNTKRLPGKQRRETGRKC